MLTPPTLRTWEGIERDIVTSHAEIQADTQLFPIQKSAKLIRTIEIHLSVMNVEYSHAPNLHKALDRSFKPEDMVWVDKRRNGKYIPMDTLLRRALDGCQLDRDVICKGWIELHEEAGREIRAFKESFKREREDVGDGSREPKRLK